MNMQGERAANADASVRVFFVPHHLEQPRNETPNDLKTDDTPVRVPFEMSGALASASGTVKSKAIVMVDGYKTTKDGSLLGGNQDPCVGGAPVGVFHAYCRIASPRKRDDKVHVIAGESELLPDIAHPRDIIAYGKPDLQRNEVGIDTVIVVDRTPVFSDVIAGVTSEEDAYAFSISDQLPLGFHAGQNQQRIVIGRTEGTWEAVQGLRSSFVPLAERTADGQLRVARVPAAAMKPSDWKELRERFEEMFSGKGRVGNMGFITEFPVGPGLAMIRALIERSGDSVGKSGQVLVPPLRFRCAPARFGKDGVVRPNEEHLRRLRAYPPD
jgi:hypothetical protein